MKQKQINGLIDVSPRAGSDASLMPGVSIRQAHPPRSGSDDSLSLTNLQDVDLIVQVRQEVNVGVTQEQRDEEHRRLLRTESALRGRLRQRDLSCNEGG